MAIYMRKPTSVDAEQFTDIDNPPRGVTLSHLSGMHEVVTLQGMEAVPDRRRQSDAGEVVEHAEGVMKVFTFIGAETDWVAANSEAEARDTLMRHYGIGPDDIDGSYESVIEEDPAKVEFFTDEYDEEEEETVTQTAAEMMAGKTKPFVLGSTYQ